LKIYGYPAQYTFNCIAIPHQKILNIFYNPQLQHFWKLCSFKNYGG